MLGYVMSKLTLHWIISSQMNKDVKQQEYDSPHTENTTEREYEK